MHSDVIGSSRAIEFDHGLIQVQSINTNKSHDDSLVTRPLFGPRDKAIMMMVYAGKARIGITGNHPISF